MTIEFATRTAAAVVLAAGLAGCWDSTEVTVHNPGEYKGPADPLLCCAQSASLTERDRAGRPLNDPERSSARGSRLQADR